MSFATRETPMALPHPPGTHDDPVIRMTAASREWYRISGHRERTLKVSFRKHLDNEPALQLQV
jgi:hypothetical protein